MEDEIDKRIEVLHTLHYLQQIQYQRSDLPIAGAIPLYATSELNYHELLQDLEKFFLLINIERPAAAGKQPTLTFEHGLVIADCSQYSEIMFRRPMPTPKYVRFLLKLPYDDNTADEPVLMQIKNIEDSYGRVALIASRYLLTAVDDQDDVLYDYFDAYAEISES